MDAKEKILSLIKEINQHNINYYVHDNPTISDSNYDILIRELENLENKSTLIQDFLQQNELDILHKFWFHKP